MKFYVMETQSNLKLKKINLVKELLNDLKMSEFTGFIKISYSQGGITKVERNEDILKN